MEIISFVIDFIIHIDKYLEAFVANYGVWVYALLFLIIFVETGVVVMPFLPGDSLLFVAGVSEMSRRKFTIYNIGGAALWVGGIVTIGYFFGNVAIVKANLEKVIWAMILIPGVVVLYGAWKVGRNRPKSA